MYMKIENTTRRLAASRSGNRRAMTLIEVLIVIALLLAIGGLVVVNLLPKQAEAKNKLVKVQIDQIGGAMKMFRLDLGRYPTDEEGIKALWAKDAIEDETASGQWKGPYLETSIPRDEFGSDWIYHQSSEQTPEIYELISPGPDREAGTDDDISNLDPTSENGEGGESSGGSLDDLS